MSTEDRFVYVTYIATTPEKVWRALVEGELTRQYWRHENVSDWKIGSEWRHVANDAERSVRIIGEVLDCVPNERLVLSWGAPGTPRAQHSRVTMAIEPAGEQVRLTVTHEALEPGSEMARKVNGGWPRVLAGMKSFLETGTPVDPWA